jgi:hypothetical protein
MWRCKQVHSWVVVEEWKAVEKVRRIGGNGVGAYLLLPFYITLLYFPLYKN